MRTEERVLRPIKHMMDMFVGLEEVKDKGCVQSHVNKGKWCWVKLEGSTRARSQRAF